MATPHWALSSLGLFVHYSGNPTMARAIIYTGPFKSYFADLFPYSLVFRCTVKVDWCVYILTSSPHRPRQCVFQRKQIKQEIKSHAAKCPKQAIFGRFRRRCCGWGAMALSLTAGPHSSSALRAAAGQVFKMPLARGHKLHCSPDTFFDNPS